MQTQEPSLIDLHTHTRYSDGGLTPTQLVERAKKIGLKAIAVTDHDSVAALPEALQAGARLGVEVVPGIELTAHEDTDSEFHFLGYFIDYTNTELIEKLKFYQDERTSSAQKSVTKLQELGYKLTWEYVESLATGAVIKPHIAFAVIANKENENKLFEDFGGLPTTGAFIQKYLIPNSPAYFERQAATPAEAIDLIHKIGGVAIMAHPCWDAVRLVQDRYIFDDDKIMRLKNLGMDGIEVFAHRDEEGITKLCIDHFLKVAQTLNLKITGGSDFHGFGSGGKDLGFQDFYLKVPYSILEELKK